MNTKKQRLLLFGLTAVFFFRLVLFLPQSLIFENEPVLLKRLLPLSTAVAFALVFSVFLAGCLTKKMAADEKPYIFLSLYLGIDSLFFSSLSDFRSLFAVSLAILLVLLRKKVVLCMILSIPSAFFIPILRPGAFFSVIPLVVSIFFLDVQKKDRMKNKPRWLQWIVLLLAACCGFLFSVLHPTLLDFLKPLLPNQSQMIIGSQSTRAMILLLVSMIPMLLFFNSFFNRSFRSMKKKENASEFSFYNKAYICMIFLYALQITGVIVYKNETIFCINSALPLIMLISGTKNQMSFFCDEIERYRNTKPAVFFVSFAALLFFYSFLAFRCSPTDTIFAMTNTRL